MKLLIDEMWSPAVAAQLRGKGFDVDSVLDHPELKAQPDRFLLVHPLTDGRAIVTENVNDFRLLCSFERRNGRDHPGLVFTTRRQFDRGDRRSIGRLVSALEALLESDVDLSNLELWLRPVDP